MKHYGHIDLNDNQMQRMVIQAENNFPSTPIAGRIVFKDKRLYICLEIVAGVPAWVPLTNEINMYIHKVTTQSTTWVVTHNLNTTTPMVQLYNQDMQMVLPDLVTVLDNNTLQIDLVYPMIGRAVVMSGEGVYGASKSQYSFEHQQTSSSTVWIIEHDLGYLPIVRVFVGDEEVQPYSVTHNSKFKTTITFSTPQVGVVRFI